MQLTKYNEQHTLSSAYFRDYAKTLDKKYSAHYDFTDKSPACEQSLSGERKYVGKEKRRRVLPHRLESGMKLAPRCDAERLEKVQSE